MKRNRLDIYSFESVDSGLMESIAGAAGEFMGFDARLTGNLLTPAASFNGRRQQYKAKPMLKSLEKARNGSVVLGVTELDIGLPGLNFVFGVADRRAGTALISLARLRPSFYGDNPDMQVVESRAAKEAIHELGHLLGLDHCEEEGCVMRFSHDIKATDAKGPGYCQRCLWWLASVI